MVSCVILMIKCLILCNSDDQMSQSRCANERRDVKVMSDGERRRIKEASGSTEPDSSESVSVGEEQGLLDSVLGTAKKIFVFVIFG